MHDLWKLLFVYIPVSMRNVTRVIILYYNVNGM